MIDQALYEKRVQKAFRRFAFLVVALLVILGAVNLVGCNGNGDPPPDNSFDCDDIQGSSEVLTVADPTGGYIVTFKPDISVPRAMESLSVLGPMAASAAVERGYYTATGQVFVESLDVRGAMSLSESENVLFVEQVGRVSIPTPVNYSGPEEDPVPKSWGLDRSDQRDLPLDNQYNPKGDGASTHVYILDTGLDASHPEFTGRVGECFSAYGGSCNSDSHYHGTHVAGTALGTAFGIAKMAQLHNVQVLSGGSGTTASVIAGIDWTTKHCQENNWPCVGNMSLGGGKSASLDTALCRSIDAGIAWAVAAGNDNTDACNSSPARVRQAVTVGATKDNDSRASFSNKGACLDMFAPGQNIKSAKPGGGSQNLNGTSMASPHIAGGLAICADAGLDPRDCVLANATPGKVDDPGAGSPNLLLYVGN